MTTGSQHTNEPRLPAPAEAVDMDIDDIALHIASSMGAPKLMADDHVREIAVQYYLLCNERARR